jgi:protein involved in polysaccharide export with SLBB domain
MTAKNWMTLPILFLDLVAMTNLVFADATLRPGDQIEMKLGGVPATETTSVSGIYTIDGGGAVNLPYVGRIKIAGLSPGGAEVRIESAFKASEIYTDPNIVITMQPQSRFVNVGGEVKEPKRVPYTDDLTVLGAISAAGGFSIFADQRKVRLLRGDNVVIIDVKKARVNPSLDTQVQPGDRIEVPQSLF